jgi:multiple sugar transport system substrate-binding protein
MDAQTNGYYTLMREKGYLFKGAPAHPFHAQVRSVVEPFIWQALAGEITAAEALDQAAAAADEEMARLGYGE